MAKCGCVSESIDRSSFQRLDNAEFEALLTPVGMEQLRDILKQPDLGKELQRTYFRGFSPGTIARPQAMRFLGQAARKMPGTALPQAILHAWLHSVPSARSISVSVLGREYPFAGRTSQQFYDLLETLVPASTVAALQTLAPACTEREAPNPLPMEFGGDEDGQVMADSEESGELRNHAEAETRQEARSGVRSPVQSNITVVPTDAVSAVHSPDLGLAVVKTRPPTFDNVVQRDHWLWRDVEVPLLAKDDIEHLQEMPDPDAVTEPVGSAWADYAQRLADELKTV
jgi:hypothetical protein